MSYNSNWFRMLFGVDENTNYQACKNDFEIDGTKLTSKGNQKSYIIGNFDTPSLNQLRQQGGPALDYFKSQGQKLKFQIEKGDVATFHGDTSNRYSLFQAASQFNCLEFPTSEVKPEAGVTDYANDKTQGPACAIACGPGTVYRNYFVPVKDTNGEVIQKGQTSDCQINNLRDVNEAIHNTDGSIFRVTGGYTMASDEGLKRLNQQLGSLDANELDELRGKLMIGVHKDVQVTSTQWGKSLVQGEHIVTQVYGSACSVSYSQNSLELWEPFASLVLDASYEATLWAALMNAYEHKEESSSKKVFLTCLGGGVFGNEMKWIINAMKKAFAIFNDTGLEIKIVVFGYIEPEIRDLAASYPNAEKKTITNNNTTTTTTTTTISNSKVSHQLTDKEDEYFKEITSKSFSDQAKAYINVFWDKCNQQAEFIYNVSWQQFCEVDMKSNDIPSNEAYRYEEGSHISSDYPDLHKNITNFVNDNEEYNQPRYQPSRTDKSSKLRKGQRQLSFLEYLLNQYGELDAEKKKFCSTIINAKVSDASLETARKNLEIVKEKIKEKEEAQEQKEIVNAALETALATAKASIRSIQENLGMTNPSTSIGEKKFLFFGTLWWMDKEWEMKQAKYGNNAS